MKGGPRVSLSALTHVSMARVWAQTLVNVSKVSEERTVHNVRRATAARGASENSSIFVHFQHSISMILYLRCDQCEAGWWAPLSMGYPNCQPCECSSDGSLKDGRSDP